VRARAGTRAAAREAGWARRSAARSERQTAAPKATTRARGSEVKLARESGTAKGKPKESAWEGEWEAEMEKAMEMAWGVGSEEEWVLSLAKEWAREKGSSLVAVKEKRSVLKSEAAWAMRSEPVMGLGGAHWLGCAWALLKDAHWAAERAESRGQE